MTDKELQQAKKDLHVWENGIPRKLNEKEKELDTTYSCIDMINSILAYNWFGDDAEGVMTMEENNYYNYLAKYVNKLGRNRVVELIANQIKDISHIERNVYTDYEGCSYNSIVWVR